jgi:hypothetical protein
MAAKAQCDNPLKRHEAEILEFYVDQDHTLEETEDFVKERFQIPVT